MRADAELVEDLVDAPLDLVAHAPYAVQVQVGGVVEYPVLVALALEDRAGVPAPHGDDDVRGAHDLIGPGLGELVGDVYAAALFHDMPVDAISELDMSYTPPLGSPWDAVQVAAQAWVTEYDRPRV
ncbi:MAG: hypothetical protein BGO38_09600 [Cellulomonas sp. 73-145]|nr:MAG: hypothetical protein BGO38_09600 [Cellulomonas sp. 73-145]